MMQLIRNRNDFSGLVAAGLVAIAIPTAAVAKKFTPPHPYQLPNFYQLMKTVFVEFDEMHEFGGTKAHIEDVSYAIGERKPHHVIQKAHAILKKVE